MSESLSSMNRREAMRLLAAGVVLPATPSRQLLRKARALLATDFPSRTLNAHQAATVITLTELILPRTDTPGASDVGTIDFIDLMLTEWYEEKERATFLNGLADVDAHSQSLFTRDFIDCQAGQQAEILSWLGETMQEKSERQNPQGESSGAPPDSGEDFYPMLRRLALTAYFTSETGADALHFELIPGHFDGCSPPTQIEPAASPTGEGRTSPSALKPPPTGASGPTLKQGSSRQ